MKTSWAIRAAGLSIVAAVWNHSGALVDLSLLPAFKDHDPFLLARKTMKSKMRSLWSRRDWLAAVGAATVLSKHPSRSIAAYDKINLAFIGVGGRGGANLKEMTKDSSVQVAAICDINPKTLERVSESYPSARKYVDLRRLLDDLKDIDGVVVSTTEHTHAYATVPALRQGKPVYCEKPLTYCIAESRKVMQAAIEANVPTQMGTQIHASSNYHRVVELIQSGAIGDVYEAHVWVSRAWGWQSPEDALTNKDIVSVTDRPKEESPVPDGIDWDLWIGPAPYRPYNEVYLPGPKWYRWWDFANGTLSDLGAHMIDLPFWALKLDSPRFVEAFGPEPHPELAPASMRATYEYGPRGNMPACKLHWYQGSEKPPLVRDGLVPNWGSGILFVGSKGMLLSDYGKHVLMPEEKFKDFERPAPWVPDSPGQQLEWVQAVKNRTPTASPFSYAGLLTMGNLVGVLAYRTGKRIEWDGEKLEAKNNSFANSLVDRKPRAGWSLS